jgi:hypothetical protein
MNLYAIALENKYPSKSLKDGTTFDVSVHLIVSDCTLTITDILRPAPTEHSTYNYYNYGIYSFKEKFPKKYIANFEVSKDNIDLLQNRIAYLISDYNNAILMVRSERNWVQKLCKAVLKNKDKLEFYFKYIPLPIKVEDKINPDYIHGMN